MRKSKRDWRKIIRCNSCAAFYKAKIERDFNLVRVTDGTGIDITIVSFNECPKCYAYHTAEFSLS